MPSVGMERFVRKFQVGKGESTRIFCKIEPGELVCDNDSFVTLQMPWSAEGLRFITPAWLREESAA